MKDLHNSYDNLQFRGNVLNRNQYRRLRKDKIEHIKESLYKALLEGPILDKRDKESCSKALRILGDIFFYAEEIRALIRDGYDRYTIDGINEPEFQTKVELAQVLINDGLELLRVIPQPKLLSSKLEEEKIDITISPSRDYYPSIQELFLSLIDSNELVNEDDRVLIKVTKLSYEDIDIRQYINALEVPAFAKIILDTLQEITDELQGDIKYFQSRTPVFKISEAITLFRLRNRDHSKYSDVQIAYHIHNRYKDYQKDLPFEVNSIQKALKRD